MCYRQVKATSRFLENLGTVQDTHITKLYDEDGYIPLGWVLQTCGITIDELFGSTIKTLIHPLAIIACGLKTDIISIGRNSPRSLIEYHTDTGFVHPKAVFILTINTGPTHVVARVIDSHWEGLADGLNQNKLYESYNTQELLARQVMRLAGKGSWDENSLSSQLQESYQIQETLTRQVVLLVVKLSNMKHIYAKYIQDQTFANDVLS